MKKLYPKLKFFHKANSICHPVPGRGKKSNKESRKVLSLLNSYKIMQNYPVIGEWHPTPVLLPGKAHGQRSLVGCSPWGHRESDTTERLHFHFSLSCTGEGNGNPLQCSCLENPRDGGAWWAAISGVAQSRTQLKRLSSSSSSSSSHKKNEMMPLQHCGWT